MYRQLLYYTECYFRPLKLQVHASSSRTTYIRTYSQRASLVCVHVRPRGRGAGRDYVSSIRIYTVGASSRSPSSAQNNYYDVIIIASPTLVESLGMFQEVLLVCLLSLLASRAGAIECTTSDFCRCEGSDGGKEFTIDVGYILAGFE